ncbi:MAG: phosphodiester glycosidase family protein, partial [Oscillospiraceae bacterium]|nr:phosphodiester glycosidase family protein [Oscillospiraceae bacterium]
VAPEPLLSGFGKVSTANASEIMAIVQQARDSGLLGPEERIVFDPNVEFNNGSYYQDIQYYLDDTLLVICWKEIIDGNTCTFCEVKMQDGSQIRRKLAGDMFGSDVLEYTTSMHKATNAVVSVNADYYRFRDMGIVAYNRQLYRFNESLYLNRYGQDLKKYNCVDTLFVTASGDFLFFHQYEETTPEAVQQFITDNDIIFSVAFGPVLVENGMLNASRDFEEEWYPIGEVNTGYSRAGIGQVDKLHYLYMSLNHSDEKQARWHVKEFAQHFYEKGVISAYNLDGGQTGEIVFQGNEAYNHVDHVNGTSSRQVSDMIYFASAINGEEVTQ